MNFLLARVTIGDVIILLCRITLVRQRVDEASDPRPDLVQNGSDPICDVGAKLGELFVDGQVRHDGLVEVGSGSMQGGAEIGEFVGQGGLEFLEIGNQAVGDGLETGLNSLKRRRSEVGHRLCGVCSTLTEMKKKINEDCIEVEMKAYIKALCA